MTEVSLFLDKRNRFTTRVTDVLSCQNYMLIGKRQQSLKAWIPLLAAKPQTWVKLSGRVNGREKVDRLGFVQPTSAEDARSKWVQRANTTFILRQEIQKLACERSWSCPQNYFGPHVPPCLQEEWYSPCCLGELTLLSGTGHISRAHCFHRLSAQTERSCLPFSLDMFGF